MFVKLVIATLLFFTAYISIGCEGENEEIQTESLHEERPFSDIKTPWDISTPEHHGFKSEDFDKFINKIKKDTYVSGLVIVKDGTKIKEYYLNHNRYKHEQYSVTKSIIGLLVGIAIDEGYIDSVNQKLKEFFPEINEYNSSIANITIEDLLLMRSGVEWNEWEVELDKRDEQGQYKNDWFRMVEKKDSLKFYSDRPLIHEPGEKWVYNSGDSHVLMKILKQETGKKPLVFAKENLFEPLNIDSSNVEWDTAEDGINMGGSGIRMHTKDLAKIGYLILNNGEYREKQVVSNNWIEKTINSKLKIENKDRYRFNKPFQNVSFGYHWWIFNIPEKDLEFIAANGSYGQGIFIFPDYNLIMAVNSTPMNLEHSDVVLRLCLEIVQILNNEV
ncbi:serine hydrolase domain-containing protein [Natranaerobius thermophilus]|uniref:Beta-lactamase n=1 Tax=Natranaerobius thermophilus (strain ATCC BAA-1301 / DSM 18059 / JW/NM-WN-LF) TaxID=457570 RepID=B2A285_NATTJ|nr:serine hydrolase [Natranaerobius thermophilus]ACB86193.1 beta-lactamase [Natranaerobius thermophilus JW/NM-WN-LF]